MNNLEQPPKDIAPTNEVTHGKIEILPEGMDAIAIKLEGRGAITPGNLEQIKAAATVDEKYAMLQTILGEE